MECEKPKSQQGARTSKSSERKLRQSSQDDDVYLTPKNMLENSIRKNALGQVIPRKSQEMKPNDGVTDENGYTLARTESWEHEVKISFKRKTMPGNEEPMPLEEKIDQLRRQSGFLEKNSKYRCRKSIVVTGFIIVLIVVIGALVGLILLKPTSE